MQVRINIKLMVEIFNFYLNLLDKVDAKNWQAHICTLTIEKTELAVL